MAKKEGKRAGEAEGRSITWGERAINWAKAIAIIVPLMGIGAVGGIKVPEIWHEYQLTEADGKTEIELTHFQQSVKKFSEEMREEIERIDLEKAELLARLNEIETKLSRQDTVNYRDLVKKLDSQEEQLKIIAELVN